MEHGARGNPAGVSDAPPGRGSDRLASWNYLVLVLMPAHALPLLGEGRAQKVDVGVDRLPDEPPEGFALLLGHLPVSLGLMNQPPDATFDQVLSKRAFRCCSLTVWSPGLTERNIGRPREPFECFVGPIPVAGLCRFPRVRP